MHRIILGIGDVRLIAGLTAAAQFAVRECEFKCAEVTKHLRQLCGCHARRQFHQPLAWHMQVDEHTCKLTTIQRHRLIRDCQIEVVTRNEFIDHVEFRSRDTVQLDNAVILDSQ